jgi:N,N'-diacetyllegionaminate synthase
VSVYIIAEAGINHNGSMDAAQSLIMCAKQAGANAVKFQTYVTDDICRKDNPEYDVLKRCELTYKQFVALNELCRHEKIDFISTPDTIADAEFLDTLGMRYLKIGSANARLSFLLKLNRLKTPLIVSLGMGAHPSSRVTNVACWMHCVSAYPVPFDQANMGVINGARITGFSDHTEGPLAGIIAVSRGARIIEKHFTLDKAADGPDHRMSADPDDLKRYIGALRRTESMLGDGRQRIMPCEQKTIDQLEARL